MNQIIHLFSLTLLILMLVSQVFSEQKSDHSLCFSVPCANCKQLDKFPFSRQHPLNIVLRQQLSINFFSVSSIDSTSINFQFSQKQCISKYSYLSSNQPIFVSDISICRYFYYYLYIIIITLTSMYFYPYRYILV